MTLPCNMTGSDDGFKSIKNTLQENTSKTRRQAHVLLCNPKNTQKIPQKIPLKIPRKYPENTYNDHGYTNIQTPASLALSSNGYKGPLGWTRQGAPSAHPSPLSPGPQSLMSALGISRSPGSLPSGCLACPRRWRRPHWQARRSPLTPSWRS